MTDDKIWQEFYCRKDGGGCGGYVVVRLNMNINGIVEVVCPQCRHRHRRCIVTGEIKENGRDYGSIKQEITPTIAAWSAKSRFNFPNNESGDSVVKRDFLKESWLERFGVVS